MATATCGTGNNEACDTEALCEAMADPNVVDVRGETPLHTCVWAKGIHKSTTTAWEEMLRALRRCHDTVCHSSTSGRRQTVRGTDASHNFQQVAWRSSFH